MEYKEFSSYANKNKRKRISKKVLSSFGIILVVILGLVTLGFMVYGLIIGIYQIFGQDILRLFT